MATERSPAVWKGSANGTIQAPVDKVWRITSDFAGLIKWAPAGSMSSCEITEGKAQIPGCVRLITTALADGSELRVTERLLELDEDKHTVKYKIEGHPLMDGMVGTFSLSAGENGSTVVDWSYEIAATSDPAKEQLISSNVIRFYESCIQNLKQLLNLGS